MHSFVETSIYIDVEVKCVYEKSTEKTENDVLNLRFLRLIF